MLTITNFFFNDRGKMVPMVTVTEMIIWYPQLPLRTELSHLKLQVA